MGQMNAESLKEDEKKEREVQAEKNPPVQVPKEEEPDERPWHNRD